MNAPETHYAKTVDGVHIAYQVFGEGLLDLVFSFGEVSSVDQMWDVPEIANFMRRLASFSRVITFDPRGNGSSDRDLGNTSFEDGMDDIGERRRGRRGRVLRRGACVRCAEAIVAVSRA